MRSPLVSLQSAELGQNLQACHRLDLRHVRGSGGPRLQCDPAEAKVLKLSLFNKSSFASLNSHHVAGRPGKDAEIFMQLREEPFLRGAKARASLGGCRRSIRLEVARRTVGG